MTNKAKLTETHIAYLHFLAGMTNDYPECNAYHVERTLSRQGLITESLPNRSGSYNKFPTVAAMPYLGI